MSTDWRPRDTTPEEDARAAVVAVGVGVAVGAVTFWLTRTLLGRDGVSIRPPAGPGSVGDGSPAAEVTSPVAAPRIGSGPP